VAQLVDLVVPDGVGIRENGVRMLGNVARRYTRRLNASGEAKR
jgi:hypothetical protein